MSVNNALSDPIQAENTQESIEAIWKRNVLMVNLGNFLHMVMYTMALGGIFDVFLYSLSASQEVLSSSEISIVDATGSSKEFSPYDQFELNLDLRSKAPQAGAPSSRGLVFVIGSLHHNHTIMSLAILEENMTQRLQISEHLLIHPHSGGNWLICTADDEFLPEVTHYLKIKSINPSLSKGQGNLIDGEHGVQLFSDSKLICQIKRKSMEVRRVEDLVLWWGHMPGGHESPANVIVSNVVYGKPPSYFFVGVLNSLQGFISLALMYPVGWLGDNTSRYKLLRWNVLIGIAAALILSFAVFLRLIICLVAGVVVFTFYQQVISTLLNAVLTDNTPPAERMKAAVNYKTFSALAMSFGPFIQLIVCLCDPRQDSWSEAVFDILLVPGWVTLPLIAVVMLSMQAVGWSLSCFPNTDENAAEADREGNGRRKRRRLDHAWLDQTVCFGQRRRFVVAVTVNVFLLFTLMANGMTVRYFSLYFTNIRKFSPAALCLLNAGCRLFIACFSQLGKQIAPCLGRSNASLVLHIGSAIFTLGIYGGGLFETSLALSVICYYMRFACLHTRDPILNSMSMDTAPPEQRTRWAALNSLRSLSFSASAMLGGWFADRWGYEFSFTVTVYALLAGSVIMIPAMLLLPRDEKFEEPPSDQSEKLAT